MLGPACGRGGIDRRDLAGDQPVEQQAHRGKLPLHVRRRMGPLTGFYVGRHIERPDSGERQTAAFTSDKELGAGPRISAAGM